MASNPLRVVWDNAADRATLTASNSVITSANLLTDNKSETWRNSFTTAAVKLAWSTAENISCAALPYINTSPTATMRVRITNEPSVTNLLNTVTGSCISWGGTAPTSYRLVTAPDGTTTAVVPKTNASTNRWQFDIPAGTYPNGTVLTISWHQKTVAHSGTGGQNITPTGWVGATGFGTVSSVPAANGYTRKSIVMTISDTSLTQNIRFYLQGTVGADDIAAWGWQLELGGTLTSYYPNSFTFTSRASTGTYIDVNGLVTTAASGVARMQYQFPSLATVPPQMLVELASTNLATQSEDFTQGIWSKTALGSATAPSVTSNFATSPAGTLTADRITFSRTGTATGDYSNIIRYITGQTNGNAYTGSIWLKSNTGAPQQVVIYGNLVGQVVTVTADWQRFSIYDVATGGAFGILFGTRGGVDFTSGGDLSLDLLVWGGQVEAGSLTSYIPTVASTVTRAADAATTSVGTRPVGYMDWWQSYNYDSGLVSACASSAIKVPGLTFAQSASAFSYGGGTTAVVYTSATSCSAMMIDIADPSNLQGYLEAPRLVAGEYFSPFYNAAYGGSVCLEDMSRNTRTDAGNLRTDVGTRHKKLSIDMSAIVESDRATMAKVVNYAGTSTPVFLSLHPENTDKNLEQAYTIYGKFTEVSAITSRDYRVYSAPIEIEGI